MKSLKQTLSLDTLQILDVIAREGSFAAASLYLNRSTSALSYQIQKLEEELGVLILDRSGHRASFTQAGKLLLEQGTLLLNASDVLYRQVQEIAQGWENSLSISYDGIIGSELLLNLMKDFETQSHTKLVVREEILSGGWEAISSGRSDILISSRPKSLPSEINTTLLGKMEMIWVASPKSPIVRESAPLHENTRQKYRIIAVSDTARSHPKQTKNILSDQPVYTVSNMTDKIKAIKTAIGIGTVARAAVEDDIALGNLIELGSARHVDIILAWHRADMGKAKTWCLQHIKKLWQQQYNSGASTSN